MRGYPNIPLAELPCGNYKEGVGNLDVRALSLAILSVGLIPAGWLLYGHCILPALVLAGVRPRGVRLVQVLGIAGIGSFSGLTVLRLLGPPRTVPPLLNDVAAVMAIAYILTFFVPGVIARLTGGPDPLIALRFILWSLAYALHQIEEDSADPVWREEAKVSSELLVKWRGDGADRLVSLWREEAAMVLENRPVQSSIGARHSEMLNEVRRLWPLRDE